jgi:hypothetical protein
MVYSLAPALVCVCVCVLLFAVIRLSCGPSVAGFRSHSALWCVLLLFLLRPPPVESITAFTCTGEPVGDISTVQSPAPSAAAVSSNLPFSKRIVERAADGEY